MFSWFAVAKQGVRIQDQVYRRFGLLVLPHTFRSEETHNDAATSVEMSIQDLLSTYRAKTPRVGGTFGPL